MALLIKDIAPVDDRLVPNFFAKPYEIPPNSPDVLEMAFTCEDFRKFWSNERLAFNWWDRTGPGERLNLQNFDDPLPVKRETLIYSKGCPGSPPRYDWSVQYACRHSRKSKKLTLVSRESVGRCCQAKIKFRKCIGQDRVEAIYHWRHNHDTTTRGRAAFPLGPNERYLLKRMIEEGHDSRTLKRRLRPTDDQMQQMETTQLASVSINIGLKDIRSALYRQRCAASHLHSNSAESVRRWLRKIEDNNGKSTFIRNGAVGKDGFMIAWCTWFQLQVMAENDRILCIDSTYKTVKCLEPLEGSKASYRSAYLFTLLVKAKYVEKGIPISFMLSNSESQYSLIPWLQWLKSSCNLRTTAFMVDCAVTEHAAIEATFPSARILYCFFHASQLWERHLKNGRSKAECDKLRPVYKAVLGEDESYEKQLRKWNDLKKAFPNGYETFIDYVEKKWFRSFKDPAFVRRWAIYHRREYLDMNTNNHIESWHKTLKRVHLMYEWNVRADYLIYILQGAVDIDFRISYWKIKNGIQVPPWTAYDKLRRNRAREIPFDQAREKVTDKLDEGKILVKSLSKPGVEYSVHVDTVEGVVVACTCDDFTTRGRPCKHMYLIEWIDGRFHVCYPRQQNVLGSKDSDVLVDDMSDAYGMDSSGSVLERYPLVQQTLTAEQYGKDREERERRFREWKKAGLSNKAEFRRHLAKAAQNFERMHDFYSPQQLKLLATQAENLARDTHGSRTESL